MNIYLIFFFVEAIPLTDQCPRSEMVSIRSGNENGIAVEKISVHPCGGNTPVTQALDGN